VSKIETPPLAGGGAEKKHDLLDSAVDLSVRRSGDSHQVVRITIAASGRKWRAQLDGKTLCVCTSPFVMSARLLIAQGFDPIRIIEMYHADADDWALRGRLGVVAATLLDGEQKVSRHARNGPPVRFPRKAAHDRTPNERNEQWPSSRSSTSNARNEQ
jgi:hypothetical protein